MRQSLVTVKKITENMIHIQTDILQKILKLVWTEEKNFFKFWLQLYQTF
jgi:hypothetical protein